MAKKKRADGGEERALTPSQMHQLHLGLSAPRLCLDFANTFEGRLTNHPQESFQSYGDLLSWSQQAGMMAADTVQRLALEATHRLTEATATLDRAIALREAIYRIFSAVAGQHSPQTADLNLLNVVLGDALAALQITPNADGFAWGWSSARQHLSRVLWPIAQSAADLLTSVDLRAVRECAATNCSWLFLDTSRNHSRRWCDMKACGNRAKARRHYERQKQARGETTDNSRQR
jgi:predicted RNA-binding Zn ribbon-like protein